MSVEIENLTEFEEYVNTYRTQFEDRLCLFRGQANSKWNIVSSAYRAIHAKYPSLDIDINLLDAYGNSIPDEVKCLYSTYKNLEDDEILCTLQHLGGGSTYIDLSRNHLVALYFACEQLQDKEDGAVYLFNSDGNNVIGEQSVVIGNLQEVDVDENNAAYPRLNAQESCFLIQTNNAVIHKEDVACIIINKLNKNNILEELREREIYHENIYPDILGFIRHQDNFDDYLKEFTTVIFRNISQKIKEACVCDMDDVISTLDAVASRRLLSDEDKNRVKYLKILGLLCAQKYAKALNILDTFDDMQYFYFSPYSKENPHESKDYDPIPTLFIVEFEKAKCYMGLKKYATAISHYEIANDVLDSLPQEIKNITEQEINDFWKSYAKALVRVNDKNLIIAQDILSRYVHEYKTDICELYMIVHDWDTAIEKLKNVQKNDPQNDYACVLLGNCYMALANKGGNKRLYIEQAVSYYNTAIAIERDTQRYVPGTELHDHYYKRAIAYRELEEFDKAEKDYRHIINPPFKNEDARHDLAYMNYIRSLKDKKMETKMVLELFFDAIQYSRLEKQARNFNDLGCVVLDMYYEKLKYKDTEIDCLIEKINQIKADLQKYPGSVQTEFREMSTNLKKDNKKHLLMVAELFFKVANLIYSKDAFANKKLGEVYYEYYRTSESNPEKSEYALKALHTYYLSQGFYLAENKKCDEMDLKIKELEAMLNPDIQIVNDDK